MQSFWRSPQDSTKSLHALSASFRPGRCEFGKAGPASFLATTTRAQRRSACGCGRQCARTSPRSGRSSAHSATSSAITLISRSWASRTHGTPERSTRGLEHSTTMRGARRQRSSSGCRYRVDVGALTGSGQQPFQSKIDCYGKSSSARVTSRR